MRYDAFISYNHAADGGLAPALQDALQHLAKPWYRRRSMTVFRDETNLSASPELFGSITDALDESRYYVLLVSPGSAHSEWVGKEIAYWSSTKTAANLRMVIVLTDGTLRWDKAEGCFDPQASTALHPSLQHVFQSDPLYIDLREARAQITSGAVKPGRDFRRLFRHPVAKIAAHIKDVDLDTIEGEDLLQHRRTLRVAWTAAAALVALTVAASFGFVSARSNAQQARDQTRSAQAGELAARSTAQLQTDAPLALALAVAADRHADSTLARDALSTAGAEPITAIFGSGARNGATVRAMAISPDGRRVATNDGTSRIVVWDVATAKRVAELPDDGRVGNVDSVAFSPDGGLLAVAYDLVTPAERTAPEPNLDPQGRNIVWNVAKGREISSWEDTAASLRSVAFAPDGTIVAGGDTSGNLILWRPGTADHTTVPTGFFSVSSVAFSADSSRVVTGTSDSDSQVLVQPGNAIVWDVATATEVASVHVGTNVTATAFAPDGRTIAIGDQHGGVRLWDSAAGTLLPTWSDDSLVAHLAFDTTGILLVSGDDNGSVNVRDTTTGGTTTTWSDGTAVSGVAFTADGRTLATGDDLGHVVLRDAHRLVPSAAFGAEVSGLAFAPGGNELGVVSAPDTANRQDSAAVRWNTTDLSRQRLDVSPPRLAAWSVDGRRLAYKTGGFTPTGGASWAVTVVDVASGRVVDQWETVHPPTAMAFAPDGTALVTVVFDSKGRLEVRDLTTHTTSGALPGDPEVRVVSESTYPSEGGLGSTLALGADGTIVAIDQQPAVQVWRPNARQPRQLTGTSPQLATRFATLSRDGRTVATIDGPLGLGDHTVHLWDAETGRRIKLPCGRIPSASVATFSPNGHAVAVGDADHHVTLCDLVAGRAVAEWSVSEAVTGLAFSDDGTQLAAGDKAGHVTRWDASASLSASRAVRDRVCDALRGYTPDDAEWNAIVPYQSYADLCR